MLNFGKKLYYILKKRSVFMTLVFLMSVFSIQAQKHQALALTPPMGWKSWNTFGTHVNEKLIRDLWKAKNLGITGKAL